MIEAALIEQCADPSLKPAIVEEFLAATGSDDPLDVTVRVGSKTFLVPKAKSPEEAMERVHDYLGKAVVRVGITQYPLGMGITDTSQVPEEVFDPCHNIRIGSALFAHVYSVVTEWYGSPVRLALEDAIEAYQTGYFEGDYLFSAKVLGQSFELSVPDVATPQVGVPVPRTVRPKPNPRKGLRLRSQDPNKADIGVELSA